MRAVQLEIHNVRSIHDVTIDLRDLSILAGANSAGKSNVVDAIRLFYGDLKWDEKRDTAAVLAADSDSWVEIEYRPAADELGQLKEEYQSADNTFRVRNYLQAGPGPEGKARAGYYAYVNGVLSDTLFYGAKNVGSGKVGKLVYIPAVSKVDEHTKLSGPSALRDLVATVMSKVVSVSPAYATLKTAFTSFEKDVKTLATDDGHSLETLENEVTAELAGWDSSFSLGIQSIQPDDILKSLIRPTLTDDTHGGEIDQLRFGAGFQRHLVYTLIKLAAKYAGAKKAVATKKEFAPELTWLLFEEPEAFLHPVQEEVLLESLRELVVEDDTQVLLTTHSSRVVSRSMNDLTRLIRLRREGGVTSTFQASQGEINAFFDAALVLDAEITPALLEGGNAPRSEVMAAMKVELWMQPQRAAAFFANHVVLVEGPSELALYYYLVDRGYMNAPAPGVMFLDCMGKYNIHRFIALLSKFGVDHSVLYDGDNGGSHDAEVTAAIDGVKSDFTKVIRRLDVDIEAELGVPSVNRQNKNAKPQWLLYHLEAGLVESSKSADVVSILNGLCAR
ncbi:ATP-dependent nuclease [Clavibacter phaseoli]|uniref:ATP-dependent nuclease n=1 Tax=Clavibacter phaseoli TaxID=1734031 RepID=UPI000E66ABDF|nr:AAA family ATPase [Clavibacter phaseoli]RIJ60535.1 hypothetical protein DZG03_01855 [Clavibacter phaseoli]